MIAIGSALGTPRVLTAAEATEGDLGLARIAELQRRGAFDEAAALAEDTARRFGADGRDAERRLALLGLAESHQGVGRWTDAIRTLSEVLAEATPSDTESAALAHALRSSSWIAIGELERAEKDIKRGISLAADAGATAIRASSILNRGNLEARRELRLQALESYEAAAMLAHGAGAREVTARALANAASISLLLGADAASIRERLGRAEALATVEPHSHDRVQILIHVARSSWRLSERTRDERDLARARAALRSADEISTDLDDPRAASEALGLLGEIEAADERREEALALTRRALFAAQRTDSAESLYRWHAQLGRLLADAGRSDAAIAAYRSSIESLNEIRHGMRFGPASSFRDAGGAVFLALVDLLLRSANAAESESVRSGNLLEAREVVEQLKAAELRDYFGDDCVDALAAESVDLDAVSPSAAVIYPIALADRLEILATLPTGIRRETVPVSGERFEEAVRELRRLLEKRTTREFLPRAQQIYDWMIRPFGELLEAHAIDTLVFVPDGALHTIPLGALHDGTRFLVERWAVATAPGLRLTNPRPRDRAKLQLLIGGLSEPADGFDALPHVKAEVRAIQERLGGRILLDESFRLDRLEDALRDEDFDIVHIASHGEFAGDATASYLVTNDGRISMDRLADLIGMARFRERPIELLTLSACETAQGDDRAALGLAGVAVRAGARSALGTLWSVNDASSAVLMSDFYRHLGDASISKAVALQRAQQALRSHPNYDHPFYWSPFVLVNDWL